MANLQQLENTLSQLIAIPSVSTNKEACQEIIEFVHGQLAPLGLHIIRQDGDNPWMIATTQDTKTPDILLAAHLDVVPASTGLFTMQKQNGKLIGRGVYDMKQAAASYIELFKEHIGELRSQNIGIMFTTDEEIGGTASIPVILGQGWRPGLVFIPDGGDNWEIEEQAKGFHDVSIVALGKTAHGSRPWEGQNAIHTLLEVLAILRGRYPHDHPDGDTLAITQLDAGVAINQLPDHAEAKIDFRTFSAESIETYKALLDELADRFSVKVTLTQYGAPLVFDKNHPAVQDFLEKLQEHLGHAPAYRKSFGGSDARYFAPLAIPCIIVESTGGGRHTEEEWIDAEDFFRYHQLLERWLLDK